MLNHGGWPLRSYRAALDVQDGVGNFTLSHTGRRGERHSSIFLDFACYSVGGSADYFVAPNRYRTRLSQLRTLPSRPMKAGSGGARDNASMSRVRCTRSRRAWCQCRSSILAKLRGQSISREWLLNEMCFARFNTLAQHSIGCVTTHEHHGDGGNPDAHDQLARDRSCRASPHLSAADRYVPVSLRRFAARPLHCMPTRPCSHTLRVPSGSLRARLVRLPPAAPFRTTTRRALTGSRHRRLLQSQAGRSETSSRHPVHRQHRSSHPIV